MKKRMLSCLLLLIPINAKAASMNVSCSKSTVEPSSTINCTVNVFDNEVSGGEGSVSVSNGTIKNVVKNKCGYGSVALDKFACVDDVVNKSMSLATYTIEVGNEGTTTFTVSNAKVVGNEFATVPVGTVSSKISIVKPTVEVKEEVKPQPKQEDKKQNIVAAKPEEKKVAVEDKKEEEVPTEEPVEEIKEEVKEERHGLKLFKVFGEVYEINDEINEPFTIDIATNMTEITFEYETYSKEDEVSINTKQIKDGFNKLVIKYSYNDESKEYIVYLYKHPIPKEENILLKNILSFICGFLVGIVVVLLFKLKNKKKNNDKTEPVLSNNKEKSLSELLK